MRILHIYKDYFPVIGGIENHVQFVAEAQAAAGHEVTVLACSANWRTNEETRAGVRIIRAGRIATLRSMPLSFAKVWHGFRLRSRIVHVHSPYPLGELIGASLSQRSGFVVTHHSDVVRQRFLLRVYGPFLRRILRRTDRIITTSPAYLDSSPWLQPVRSKCSIVPLGVDLKRFCPATHRSMGGTRLLFVGRLRYYKGLDTLLRALTRLPHAQLDIAGDGPMRKRWMRLTADLGLSSRVEFLGEVDEARLLRLYQTASVFVLPACARSEAFGSVLLEAMACGLPCVTTELGTGTSWIVKDGVTGRVVPPGDDERLSATLTELLSNGRMLQEMSSAARSRVEQNFSLQRMLQRIMEVYRQVSDTLPPESSTT